MSRLWPLALGLVMLLQVLSVQAQQLDVEWQTDRQQLIEDYIAGTEAEDFDYETYFAVLHYYQKRPLGLNKAKYDELSELKLLSEIQVYALLGHISEHGKLISIYELQAVPHWDLETIYRVLSYVTVEEQAAAPVSLKQLFAKGDHQLFVRYSQVLETKRGYKDEGMGAAYAGNAAKLYMRYRYNYGTRLSYGLTAEKDPGEEFFSGGQKQGFDFYSGHLYLRDVGKIRALVLGDYEVQMGQGLVMWAGFGFGKSSFVMNIKKTGRLIDPYTSVNENSFLRGAAIAVGSDELHFSAFGSHKAIDANLEIMDTTAEVAERITSFIESGYHRTASELEDKDAVKHTMAGGNVTFWKRQFKIGVNGVAHFWDRPWQPADALYDIHSLKNNRLYNASVDYSYIWRNIHFFGETAVSDNGAIATLNGLLVALGSKTDIALLQRHYPENYRSFLSNAFGESATPANEQGYYMALSLKPFRKWLFNAYYDVFKFPWLRFGVDAPSHGHEYLAQITYRHNKRLEMYGRVKREVKARNLSANETNLNKVVEVEKTTVRYHVSSQIMDELLLRSRVELSFFKEGDREIETGYLIYQDVIWQMSKIPLTLTMRFALFDTESFYSRIYAYENDVLYAFSIPSFFDRGSRLYFMVKYQISRNIDVWLRFAQTYFTNRKTIGSGLEEINGPTRSEVKAQLRLKF